MTLNVTLRNVVNFQTKYTLIDEQDIPLVEGYSFEVRMAVSLWACFQPMLEEGQEEWVLPCVVGSLPLSPWCK